MYIPNKINKGYKENIAEYTDPTLNKIREGVDSAEEAIGLKPAHDI
jgi:hypothetical protein